MMHGFICHDSSRDVTMPTNRAYGTCYTIPYMYNMLTHGLHGSHAVIILWTSVFMVMLYTNIDMHAQHPPMVARVDT